MEPGSGGLVTVARAFGRWRGVDSEPVGPFLLLRIASLMWVSTQGVALLVILTRAFKINPSISTGTAFLKIASNLYLLSTKALHFHCRKEKSGGVGNRN